MIIESVLLVDDDPDIRMVSGLSLTRVGKWAVHAAASGAEALALLATVRPDVILLDVMMPLMDGPTLLGRIREIPALAHVPVIFLSAKVQAREVKRYLELGAAGVIVKPFDPMKLPDDIRQLLADRSPA
jgi:CheY-like chemotaxis protein